MSELWLLLRLRAAVVRNAIRGLRHQSRLKLAFVTVFGLAVWFGLFAVFLDGFDFLAAHIPELKARLAEHLFLLFFMTLLVMLTISNGIIAFASLFKSRETAFLVATPTRFESIFAYKFLEMLVFSSWAMVILGGPLLVAYGLDLGLGWAYYPVSLAYLGTFIFIPGVIGAFVAMLTTRYMSWLRYRGVLTAVVVAALVGGGLGLRVFARLSSSAATTDLWMKGILDKLSFCQSPILPSYWISKGLTACAVGQWGDVAFFWGLLLSNAMFGLMVCYWYASRQYPRCWSLAHSPAARGPGRRRAGAHRLTSAALFFLGPRRRAAAVAAAGPVLASLRPSVWIYRLADGLLWFLDPRCRALIVKDVKSFLRDPIQWSQVLIFFGLLCVYILNLRNLSYDIASAYWRNIISFLNLGATSLTLATFTGRFVFPLLSLEGRRFWLLGLLPMERRSILMSKFLFSLLGSLLVSEGLMLLSDWMIGVSLPMALFHAGLVALICCGLSGIAVGLGAAHPNFREDSPSMIVSGYGGTLTLILSMVYIAAIIALGAAPCHLYFARSLISGEVFRVWIVCAGALAVLVAVAATVLPMAVGVRAFERMEF